MVKILYVEDNEDNLYMMSNRLKRRGYEVILARDGAEGIAMAAASARKNRCAPRPPAGSPPSHRSPAGLNP